MSDAPTTNRPVPVAPDEEGNYAGYHVGFWRKPWVRSALPWATSLGIHGGIVILALVLLATPAFRSLVQKVTQTQVNVPTTELATGDIGGVPNVGNMDDVTSANAQLDPVQQSDNPLPPGEGDAAQALSAASGGGNTGEAAAGGLTGITGAGSLADALGGGGGGGGQGSTLFGEPGGGGKFMGFDVGVNGSGGRNYRIVFVSDASGSMLGMGKTFLNRELLKAIDPLDPIQFFNVIFFKDNGYQAIFPNLVPANQKKVRECSEAIQSVELGPNSNPIPALQAAFEMKPDLIFFITDGDFSGMASYDDIVAEIRRLNEKPKVAINTVQMLIGIEGEEDPQAAKTLRLISSENGGDYRAVRASFSAIP